ncbi:MAG: YgjP-like metallopeptidase domain-containing protein [Bacteroidales bacterium]
MNKYLFEDKELGKIVVAINIRAKRFIFKLKSGQLYATMPPGCNMKDLEQAINNCRAGLLKMKRSGEIKKERTMILPGRKLRTRSTEILISTEKRSDFLSTHSPGYYKICCPLDTDFAKDSVQQVLHNSIYRLLRFEAKKYLPDRLKDLAATYKFEITGVTINSSRTRWGSCSSVKKINLSLYMMLLPDHLIDYILLHELCHTVEMNHGDRFWKLLDKCSQGRSDLLRNELKNFRTEIESH